MYPLKTALQIIRAGNEVDIECCSYDDKREKYGDRIVLKRVRLSTVGSDEAAADTSKASFNDERNPWHTKHLTMNFRDRNGNITKVHVPLIEKLNHSQVVL